MIKCYVVLGKPNSDLRIRPIRRYLGSPGRLPDFSSQYSIFISPVQIRSQPALHPATYVQGCYSLPGMASGLCKPTSIL